MEKKMCDCFLRDCFQVTERNGESKKNETKQKSWMLLMRTFLLEVLVLNIFLE